jgi:hypothetical protein
VAEIKGIEGMSPREIVFELNQGAKFVVYRYCFSALVITVMQSTGIYFVRAGQSRLVKGLPWTSFTLVAGWWGIPWGPIRTAQALWTNLQGGVDVTANVANAMKLTGVKWDVASAG